MIPTEHVDGRALAVVYALGGCDTPGDLTVFEGQRSVTVQVTVLRSDAEVCTLDPIFALQWVVLDAPLGGRRLIGGCRPDRTRDCQELADSVSGPTLLAADLRTGPPR